MIINILDTTGVFESLDISSDDIRQILSSLSEEEVNAIPFNDSWTAGQLTDHVTKSINGIAQAMKIQGKAADRNPAEREPEIKKMFLNFNVKFKSPEFILPTQSRYGKPTIIADLKKSIELLKEESNNTNLSEAINHPAFGEITKLELLHFVKFHTQRHLHQLKNISNVVNKNLMADVNNKDQ